MVFLLTIAITTWEKTPVKNKMATHSAHCALERACHNISFDKKSTGAPIPYATSHVRRFVAAEEYASNNPFSRSEFLSFCIFQ